MRLEDNSLKINLGRFKTITECHDYLIQQALGKYFHQDDYVLWDTHQRSFVKSGNSVIILESYNEATSYVNDILQSNQYNKNQSAELEFV